MNRDDFPQVETLPLLMRIDEVERATAQSRSTIYRLLRENKFPQPIRLMKRSVRWRGQDIAAWVAQAVQGRAEVLGK